MRLSINDYSSVLDVSEIEECLAAIRGQASEMCYAWGLDRPTIGRHLEGKNVVNIDLLDDPDIDNALGYHWWEEKRPKARVFAKLCEQYGLDWKTTLSHEVLELVLNPTIMSSVQIGAGFFTAMEACDAVQDEEHGEMRDGHLLSNWLYPSWFDPYGEGPFDKMEYLDAPLTLLPGGYIIYWTAETGWTTFHAQLVEGKDVSRDQVLGQRLSVKREAEEYGPMTVDKAFKVQA